MNKKSNNKAIYLKDYIPSPFQIKSVELDVTLGEDVTRVKSTLSIERNNGDDSALILDGSTFLDLKYLGINGKSLQQSQYIINKTHLKIIDVPDKFILETHVEIKPQENTTLTGLYKSDGMFCTQCEAEGFRNITYYLDRPDIMSKFRCRIEGDKDKYPVLLSNGNLKSFGDLEGGNHFTVWEDPHLKPSYLFALVAGNLSHIEDHFITKSGQEVTLRIYTRPTDITKCDFAMGALKKSMKWDEDVYGLEYDLSVFNIVAVNDFNMGAMENKSLNIFNTKYVLASFETGTDVDFDGIEGVIAHEYFHNWTGNRVTCRDWFQLSLKEGLTVFRDQEFSSDMGSRAQKRIDDVQVLRGHQFPEDDGPMAHPVRPESFVEINNFYTATVYNKGAEVIRMMYELIGPKAFRSGMDLYFSRYDGKAVTCEDFIKSMEDASGVALTQFRLWYSQAGTPLLIVEDHYNDKTGEYVIDIEQNLPHTPGQSIKKPMHIPFRVGLLDKRGIELTPDFEGDILKKPKDFVLNVRQLKEKYIFKNLKEKPTPSLLRGFSAPIKLKASLTNADLAFLLAHDTDSFAKWEAGQKLSENIIFGLLQNIKYSQKLSVPAEFYLGIEGLLADQTSDKALISEALKLPTEIYLGQSMNKLDVDGLHLARSYLRKELALKFYDNWLRLYFENKTSHPYNLSQGDKAKRKLKNIALQYLMQSDEKEALDICYNQFLNSDNMTDCVASLGALVNSNKEERQKALAIFYSRWEDDPLVIDKWFSLQAISEREGTINEVIRLSSHPSFTLKNPNRLRSLVNVFSLLNQVRFHQADGKGYEFLADKIIEVDKINPQNAATSNNFVS